MTNLDALRNPPKRETRCGTAAWLSELDAETNTAITEALANKDWKSTDLHALLQNEFNYSLGYNQFCRHRNRVCCG